MEWLLWVLGGGPEIILSAIFMVVILPLVAVGWIIDRIKNR